MTGESRWKELLARLNLALRKQEKGSATESLRNELRGQPPADIALAMEELESEQAARLFGTLDSPRAAEVLAKLGPELAREIIGQLRQGELASLTEQLPPREAAALISKAPESQAEHCVAAVTDSRATNDARNRLNYLEGSAGRLMTIEFVRLRRGMTVAQALDTVRQTDPAVDIPDDLCIVEPDVSCGTADRLVGVISIRDLVMAPAERRVEEVMATEIVSVRGEVPDDEAAALLSKHKFLALPVVNEDDCLVGMIPADDLMQVIVARQRSLYAKAVGTDAEAMEKLTPVQAARQRVPWLLGTMLIELGAGIVISHFDDVLKQVILLASFMPVISAISGNVGLQAAAITVRALDTRQMSLARVWSALLKESATALIMAIICGLVLGLIGAAWAKHLPFGLVIGGALTCSMLTVGLMGTVIPVVSKRLGFDPAATAGPFETAFQDVIGFGVFLGLATVLQHWIA